MLKTGRESSTTFTIINNNLDFLSEIIKSYRN